MVTRSAASQERKLAIVTGGNRGIGRAIVEALWAQRGYHTVIACRTVSSGEEAAEQIRKQDGGGDISVMQLDLCSMQSVRKFAKQVRDTHPRVDVLFNNAGILRWRGWVLTRDGFEEHLQANYLGHYLLTRELLPLLCSRDAARPGRVVSVGSHLHSIGRIGFDNMNAAEGFEAYGQSKLAQLLHMQALAERHASDNLLAFCMEPGEVNTDITRHFPLASALNALLRFVPERNTPAQGADTAVWIGTCAPEEARALSGAFLADRQAVDENTYSGFTAFSSLLFMFFRSGDSKAARAAARARLSALSDQLVDGQVVLPTQRAPRALLPRGCGYMALAGVLAALLVPLFHPALLNALRL